jgi:hypothetical protein
MNKEEKIRTREEWRNRVADWKESGLTREEYCRRNNLKTSKLVYWGNKLSEKKAETGGFVQVPMPGTTRSCPIRIEIGNRYCVEVGKGYDPDALEHIIGILSRA